MVQKAFTPYFEMTKPRIATLVMIMAALGYVMGAQISFSFVSLLIFLIGLVCCSAGGAVLNHYIERDIDPLMERTQNRPIPAGKLRPRQAKAFGIFLVFTGAFILLVFVNLLTAILCLVAALLYLFVYTPLKKISWLNTMAGAVPGAIPPLAGWTAATNQIEAEGILLFLILFFWQHPHFFSIAWVCRDEYEKAGFKMLSVTDQKGSNLSFQTIFFALLLLPATMVLGFVWHVDWPFYALNLMNGLIFLFFAILFVLHKTDRTAKRLLRASIIYLPVLFIIILLENFMVI